MLQVVHFPFDVAAFPDAFKFTVAVHPPPIEVSELGLEAQSVSVDPGSHGLGGPLI